MMDAEMKRWIREHLHEIKGQELRPGETLAKRLATIGKSDAEQEKWELIRQLVEDSFSDEFLELECWMAWIGFIIDEFGFHYYEIEENWKEWAVKDCESLGLAPPTVESVFFNIIEKAESYWNPNADSELCELREKIKRELNTIRKELLGNISPDEWIWNLPLNTRIEITERMYELQIQIAEVEGYFVGKLDAPDREKSVLMEFLREYRKDRAEDKERYAEQKRQGETMQVLQGKTLQVLQDKTLLGERLQGEILQGMKLQDKTLQGLQGEILLARKDARTAAHAGAGAQAEAARGRVASEGARDAAGRAEDAAMDAARESMRTGAAVRNRQRETVYWKDVVLTLQDWERVEYRDWSAKELLAWARGEGRLLGGMDARKLQVMRGVWRSRGKPDAGIFEAAWKKYHDKK